MKQPLKQGRSDCYCKRKLYQKLIDTIKQRNARVHRMKNTGESHYLLLSIFKKLGRFSFDVEKFFYEFAKIFLFNFSFLKLIWSKYSTFILNMKVKANNYLFFIKLKKYVFNF